MTRGRGLALAALLVAAGCSKEAPAAPSIDGAASEYVHALSDGTLDGYLKYDQAFQNAVLLARGTIPTDMWTGREAAMRADAKALIQRNMGQYAYNNIGACYYVIRPGASVTTKEVRQENPGSWRVFYDVSYPDTRAPAVFLPGQTKTRFLHSGTFSVHFLQVAAAQDSQSSTRIVAEADCALVDGTLSTWPVPPLTQEAALAVALQSGVLPSGFTTELNGVTGVSSDQNWGGWDQFVGAAQLLKSTLEQHGWTVAGFQPQSMYYYDIHGTITPPADSQKWIASTTTTDRYGGGTAYHVVLLEHVDANVTGFSAQEDSATATLTLHFTGCTAFCVLWNDMRALPFDLGRYVFADWNLWHNPSLARLDAVNTGLTVNYAWDPGSGWHVQR